MARKAIARCGAHFAAGWPRDIRLAVQLSLPGFLVFDLESLPRGIAAIVDIDERSIGVSASLPQTSQRYAIAHEIGHVALEHPRYVFCAAGRQDDILEREADYFAREFLVPLATLRRAFRFCRDYEQLAEKFLLDRDVMYIRFAETGLLRQVL
jgi:Zn-dependent peptidase ImmA (M78 family)